MLNGSIEKKFFYCSILFLILAVTVFTGTGFIRHDYYSYVIYHKSPMAYLQNVLLLICAVLTAFNTWLIYAKENKLNVIWFMITLGFIYLFTDATFSVHQWIREAFIKPKGVYLSFLPFVDKGDYVLIFILALGLLFTPFVLNELKKNKSSFVYFLTAVIFTITAVAADSFDLRLFNYGFQKLLQYIEEVSEAIAQIFFINSFFCVMIKNLSPNLMKYPG